jgi:hypothetical protein
MLLPLDNEVTPVLFTVTFPVFPLTLIAVPAKMPVTAAVPQTAPESAIKPLVPLNEAQWPLVTLPLMLGTVLLLIVALVAMLETVTYSWLQ